MPESVIVDYKQAMFDAKDVEALRAEFARAWAANAIGDTAARGALKEYYDARKEELVAADERTSLQDRCRLRRAAARLCRNGPGRSDHCRHSGRSGRRSARQSDSRRPVIRNMEADAKAIREAICDMESRLTRIETRTVGLREYLLTTLQATNIRKVECPWFAVSVKKKLATGCYRRRIAIANRDDDHKATAAADTKQASNY